MVGGIQAFGGFEGETILWLWLWGGRSFRTSKGVYVCLAKSLPWDSSGVGGCRLHASNHSKIEGPVPPGSVRRA